MKSVFISSTFKDMNAERDLIHESIFPKLRKRLEKYGEDLQELDLRWGVDTSRMTEEESGKQVIETCLNAIDRCRPYMIILLGNRYGWIPPKKIAEAANDTRLSEMNPGELSITQMEIMYGALLKEASLERCIFCFRDEKFPEMVPLDLRGIYASEDEEHARKLRKLKEKILQNGRARILHYPASWNTEKTEPDGLQKLEEDLTESFWEILSADIPHNAVSPEEAVLRSSFQAREGYLSSYYPRIFFFKTSGEMVTPYKCLNRGRVWITAGGGLGKSAFLSYAAAQAEKDGCCVFLYFAGLRGCSSVDTFLQTLLFWLGKESGNPVPDGGGLARSALLDKAEEILTARHEHPYCLLLDGLDQMEEGAEEIVFWLNKVLASLKQYGNLRRERCDSLIISSVPETLEDFKKKFIRQETVKGGYLEYDTIDTVSLPNLLAGEANQILERHAGKRCKTIDRNVRNRILEKRNSENPFYLSMLLQRLFMMNGEDFRKAEKLAPGMEGLSLYMCSLADSLPDSLREIPDAVFRDASRILGQNAGELQDALGKKAASYRDVLSLTALSRRGLQTAQLSGFLDEMGEAFPPMLAEQFFTFLQDTFTEDSEGRWSLSHRLLYENIRSSISEKEKNAYYRILLQDSLQKEKQDPADILYYAWKAGKPQEAAAVLTDRKVLPAFRKFLRSAVSEKDTAFLDRLWGSGDTAQEMTARAVLTDPDYAFSEYAVFTELLNRAADAAASADSLFFVLLARAYFSIYEIDTEPMRKLLETCLLLFRKMEKPEEAAVEGILGLYFHLENHADRFTVLPIQTEFLSAAEEFRKAGKIESAGLCTLIPILLKHAELQKPFREASERQTRTDQMKHFLEEIRKLVPEVCLQDLQLTLARRMAQFRFWKDACTLASSCLEKLRKRYYSRLSFMDGMVYGRALMVLYESVKKEAKGKYAQEYFELMQDVLSHYPLPQCRMHYAESMYYLSLYPEDVPALQNLTAEEFLDRAIGIQEECLGESFEGHPDYTVDWYLYNILQRILKTKNESYFDSHPSVFESFRQKCLKYDSLFQGDTTAYRVSGAAAACRYFLSRENGERALYWAEQLKEGDGSEVTKKGISLLKETERHLLMAAVFLKWGDLREASDRIRKTEQILTSVKDPAAEGGRMPEWETADGNCRKMDLRLQAIRGGEFSTDAAGDDWIFGLELSALRADAADRTGCPGKARELRREIFLRYRAGFPDSFCVSQILSEEPEKVYSLRNCFCSLLKDFFCREMPEETEYMAEQYCCLYSRCIPGRMEGRNGLLLDDFLRLYDLYWKEFPEGSCVRLRDIQYAVMAERASKGEPQAVKRAAEAALGASRDFLAGIPGIQVPDSEEKWLGMLLTLQTTAASPEGLAQVRERQAVLLGLREKYGEALQLLSDVPEDISCGSREQISLLTQVLNILKNRKTDPAEYQKLIRFLKKPQAKTRWMESLTCLIREAEVISSPEPLPGEMKELREFWEECDSSVMAERKVPAEELEKHYMHVLVLPYFWEDKKILQGDPSGIFAVLEQKTDALTEMMDVLRRHSSEDGRRPEIFLEIASLYCLRLDQPSRQEHRITDIRESLTNLRFAVHFLETEAENPFWPQISEIMKKNLLSFCRYEDFEDRRKEDTFDLLTIFDLMNEIMENAGGSFDFSLAQLAADAAESIQKLDGLKEGRTELPNRQNFFLCEEEILAFAIDRDKDMERKEKLAIRFLSAAETHLKKSFDYSMLESRIIPEAFYILRRDFPQLKVRTDELARLVNSHFRVPDESF